MATPAAILQILVEANSTQAVTNLRKVDTATAHTAHQTEIFHTRMRKSWHGVTTSAGGYVTALVGAAGVVEGIKKSVEAAGTLQVAQGQLRQTVKTAGITWAAHNKQLEDYVVAARKAKGFTDTDLEKSLAGNIRTTKSVAEAQKLTNAAMDVARAKGIDLYAAQQQLGRVFLGNSLAIRRLGIQFTPTTKAQDALAASTESGNKKLKAQAKQLDMNANRTAALAAIQKSYGGDARTYANSTQGQLAKFHANVDALEATIGQTLLPVLSKLAEKGAEAATKIEEHWPEIKKDIGDVVRPIEHVAEAFFSFGKAHPEIAKLAGSLTVAALAVHKIDQHTGAFSLLAKVGKTALGGGATGGGGIIAKITGKAAGAPVYVTNWEMIRGGGGAPGGGALKAAEKDAEKVGLGAAAAGGTSVAATAGFALAIPAAAFLGFKGITDDDKAMTKWLDGLHAKLNRLSGTDLPSTRDGFTRTIGKVQGVLDDWAMTSVPRDLQNIRQVTTDNMKKIEGTIGDRSLAAKVALSSNFADAADAVKQSMKAGVTSTRAGMAEINSLFKSELAQFGITGKSADRIAEVRASTQLTRTGHAMGGFIGQPGEKGGDTVPMSLPASGWAILTSHQQDALSYGLSRLGMASGGRVPIIAGRGEYAAGPDQLPMFDLAAKAAGFSGLDGLFASVNQPHYMSRGGDIAAGPLAGVHARVANAARTVLSRFPGLSVTSTTGGKHAPGSYHYLGEAVDLGGPSGLMNTASDWIKHTIGAGLTEGIHDPNLSIKYGKTVPASYWGSAVWQEHLNHIHMAIADGQSGARGSALGSFGGGSVKRVKYRGPGGMLGQIGQAALDRARTAANSRLSGMGDLAGFTGGGSGGANQALGRRMMLAAGWPGSQWPALKTLWTNESGWDTTAKNPSSGAYGIPQSLPASKMASAGKDWLTNPATQIRWGLKYIKGTYGSPGAALGRWMSRSPHWYAKGGFVGGRVPMGNGGDVVGAFDQAIRSTRANRTEALALFEAGIVESGLRNLNYGDADSLGALQERVSIYGRAHALNPYASATRFLGQVKALRPWRGTPGGLAQAAQRSRFPSRYDHVAGRAMPYVQALFGGGARRFAKGGFVGGRVAMSGGGDPIGQFIGGLTPKPPKAPKAGPKPPKPVEGLNPNNNRREWHTPAVWRDIKIRYQQAHHGRKAPKKPPPEIPNINPFTGKTERHTSPQWHLIRMQWSQHLQRLKRHEATFQAGLTIPSEDTTAQISLGLFDSQGAGYQPDFQAFQSAQQTLTTSAPGSPEYLAAQQTIQQTSRGASIYASAQRGKLDAQGALLGADMKKLAGFQAGVKRINNQLANKKLTHSQRSVLEAHRTALLGAEQNVVQDITGLKTDIRSSQDELNPLTQAIQDNTQAQDDQSKLLQQQLDLSKQALDAANKFGAVSQSQYGALRSEIANIANGVLGGRVGLGFATPSFPGKVASL